MTLFKFTRIIRISIYCIGIILLGCQRNTDPNNTLTLATTTSTENSGLLDHILPDFEQKFDSKIEVIAVGTGQAIALGKSGDADVLLVHAPDFENTFVSQGYGTKRYQVMYNDFIIVGPKSDPALIRGIKDASRAMTKIHKQNAPWASRGDESGTHMKENYLWSQANIIPKSADNWYYSLGQGMGATLQFANETDSYTLTDRATYLMQADILPYLTIMVGSDHIRNNLDQNLYNLYSIIPINPNRHQYINHDLALQFTNWFTSTNTQTHIANFGKEKLGQPIFYTFVR
tara:strand:- start:175 stop:1038 length:864 start_codon:yes stop_codon:yes gene_type:complete